MDAHEIQDLSALLETSERQAGRTAELQTASTNQPAAVTSWLAAPPQPPTSINRQINISGAAAPVPGLLAAVDAPHVDGREQASRQLPGIIHPLTLLVLPNPARVTQYHGVAGLDGFYYQLCDDGGV